jgi:hypothetical protein
MGNILAQETAGKTDQVVTSRANTKKETTAQIIERLTSGDHREVTKRDRTDAIAINAYRIGSAAVATAIQAGVAITTGYIMPHVAAVTIGSIALNSGIAARQAAATAKERRQLKERENEAPKDEKTGLYKKVRPASIEEDAKKVNPAFHDAYDNSKNNCALCTVAYEMRRRGYDVLAARSVRGFTNYELSPMFKGFEKRDIDQTDYRGSDNPHTNLTRKDAQQFMTEAKAQGVGARGYMSVLWPGGAGHAIAYEVTEKGPAIVDAQSGEVYDTPAKIESFMSSAQKYAFARWDDLPIGNIDVIKGVAVR